jgi:hypothetical protein
MALHPTAKSVSFDILTDNYSAVNFQDALANFLTHINNPGVSAATTCQQAEDMLIPFHCVPVFHNIKFTKYGQSEDLEISDAVHTQPKHENSQMQINPA